MKRTKQIDDSREVQIGGTKANPIWTEVGQLAMSGDDNTELSDNLRLQRRASAVNRIVQEVIEGTALWLENCILGIAPISVIESYTGVTDDRRKLFSDWIAESDFKFIQEGLTSKVFCGGKELASTKAKVNPAMEADVLAMLKFEAIMARMGGIGKS